MSAIATHTVGSPPSAASPQTLWGYPKGVYLLSFTEMWERFSYYGMLALLVLFLTAAVEHGGFGWDRPQALKLYGFYTGLIFSAPLVGGWIANRFWGERRCILVGGMLLVCGHACLSGTSFMPPAGGTVSFFAGLALIVAGTALLKPTISSIIGRFFTPDDQRRDGAFAAFFVGIYIGSLGASLVVGFLGERIGWHWGFGAAGIGMTFGMVAYLCKQQPYLGDLGVLSVGSSAPGTARRALTGEQRDAIKVLLLQGVFTVAYAAAFYQKGGLLTLFAREQLDRRIGGWEIPVTWFLTVSTATFIIVVPLLARRWERLERAGRNPAACTKLGWGLMMLAIGYAVIAVPAALADDPGVKAGWGWLVLTYVCFGIGDALVWPTQISLVSRLAPPELSAVFVGGWYITIGLGSWLTGYIGALGYTWGMGPLFAVLSGATASLGLLLWAAAPYLRRLGRGVA
jgi:POT family proton-dependent oligopeptide transporter